MATKKRIEIGDLPQGYADELTSEDQAKIAGGLIVKFSDLLVSSYQTGGSSHGDSVPMETMSLNFRK